MSQRKIIGFMAEHPNEWFSARDLCNTLNLPKNRCHTSINKLDKGKFIIKKQILVNYYMYKEV